MYVSKVGLKHIRDGHGKLRLAKMGQVGKAITGGQ